MRKHILASLMMVALFPLTSFAQLGSPAKVIDWSGNITNAYYTNYVATVSLDGSSAITLQLVTSNNSANTAATIITVDRSLDGANWVTGWAKMSMAGTGTLTANCVSNWTANADKYWRISVTNATAGSATLTNNTLLYINKKPGL